ncbi:uncharacterized protein BCR38DRAFT_473021 [Pseudomassariella vexata]|uniref:Uncharacterized protein n=1 Tax=Pseudomassariella vexata TaxID=1141098 RepID=A0A1Y2E7X3_9PEZI|nr:uncharacterized protein BCR38DRAFT_473021 [Pseudomassariella vexata]ORY67668.1 hypothetical protein BCR38DRAFT_473021 [Pseudomassariella vexata]
MPSRELSEARVVEMANILGIIGTLGWTARLLFQLHNNSRRRRVLEIDGWRKGSLVSLVSLPWFLWGVFSQMATGMHAVTMSYNLSMIIQPHINVLAMFILFAQIFTYEFGSSVCVALVLLAVMMAMIGSFEATYIIHAKTMCKLDSSPNCAIGTAIVAVAFLAWGWLPLYIESWRHQGRAVSVGWIGLTFGMFGALNSCFSMVVQQPYNILNPALYMSTFVLEFGLLLAHVGWLYRTRAARRDAAAQGISFDELANDYAKNGLFFKWSASRKWTPGQEAVQTATPPPRRVVEHGFIRPQTGNHPTAGIKKYIEIDGLGILLTRPKIVKNMCRS